MINFIIAALTITVLSLGFTTIVLFWLVSMLRLEREAVKESTTPTQDKMKADFAKGFDAGVVHIPTKGSINQATPTQWDNARQRT